MNSEPSAMMRQIQSVPDLYQEINAPFRARACRLLEEKNIRDLSKLIFTGCGDSYCAAQIGAGLFERFTNLDCVCKPSIDLAWIDDIRTLSREDRAAALFGISVSGGVTRVAEALQRASRQHVTTVAVTGNPESLVGRSATHIIDAAIPPFIFAPGVRSYCASVLMMTHLAICWGEACGTLQASDVQKLLEVLDCLPALLKDSMPQMLHESQAVAQMLMESTGYEFIGSGLSYHSGWFGMAKILETLGKPAAACNAEDWFHMQYFTKELSGTSTCILSHETGFTAEREAELLYHAKTMGRAVWVVTDRDDLEQYPCIHIPKLSQPVLLPLVEALPLAAVASELCDLLGEQYMRGAEGPWAPCEGCALIANGELRIPEYPPDSQMVSKDSRTAR